jgi:hypothetical protein
MANSGIAWLLNRFLPPVLQSTCSRLDFEKILPFLESLRDSDTRISQSIATHFSGYFNIDFGPGLQSDVVSKSHRRPILFFTLCDFVALPREIFTLVSSFILNFLTKCPKPNPRTRFVILMQVSDMLRARISFSLSWCCLFTATNRFFEARIAFSYFWDIHFFQN